MVLMNSFAPDFGYTFYTQLSLPNFRFPYFMMLLPIIISIWDSDLMDRSRPQQPVSIERNVAVCWRSDPSLTGSHSAPGHGKPDRNPFARQVYLYLQGSTYPPGNTAQ